MNASCRALIVPENRTRWRACQSGRAICEDRMRRRPTHVTWTSRLPARGGEELEMQSLIAADSRGDRGQASVAGVRESAPQIAWTVLPVQHSCPAAPGHLGAVMRNCTGAPLQLRPAWGAGRLRGARVRRRGDCASRLGESGLDRRDCAGASTPDLAGARAGRTGARRRTSAAPVRATLQNFGPQPSATPASLAETLGFLDNGLRGTIEGDPKEGDQGQAQLNPWNRIRISGTESETRLDLTI